MKKAFWKYHGTGNDFILLNNFDLKFSHSPERAISLCDRHYGIGSDGLIIIEKTEEADFKMVFYNPDGSQSFCGNGSRCAVMFSKQQGIITKNTTNFIATDGKHLAEIKNNTVNLQMNQPKILPLTFIETQLPIIGKALIDTGSPHLVLFIDNKLNILELDVRLIGSKIRYSPLFKKNGVNVNFVNIDAENNLSIRTYERGVEDETLSCGTGVTASAIAYHSLFIKKNGPVLINLTAIGGLLQVKYDYKYIEYFDTQLCGPAEIVYSGEINYI